MYGLLNRENGHFKKVLEVLDLKYSSTLQSSTSTSTFNFYTSSTSTSTHFQPSSTSTQVQVLYLTHPCLLPGNSSRNGLVLIHFLQE